MPHFGLMEYDSLGEEQAALMRAKLHIRCGRRRLRQGKVSVGIVTLYDALNFAMLWYLLSHGNKGRITIKDGENIYDDSTAYRILLRSGVIDDAFRKKGYDRVVEAALADEANDYAYSGFLDCIEDIMQRLAVMPFDESALPPEDPASL